MTPQSNFMVVAPVAAGREAELRDAAGLHEPPARAWSIPTNGLVPFGRFERLHFARFVMLDDADRGRPRAPTA